MALITLTRSLAQHLLTLHPLYVFFFFFLALFFSFAYSVHMLPVPGSIILLKLTLVGLQVRGGGGDYLEAEVSLSRE